MNFPARSANGKKTSNKTNVAKTIALKSFIKVFILFSLETKKFIANYVRKSDRSF